jgi:Leucine-rich repeat (LRR) protein
MRPLNRVIAIVIITSFAWTSCTETSKAVEVTFPDTSLEARIRDTLGIPTGPILDTDMETMGYIAAANNSIYDLQGLEYATNLYGAQLSNNHIIDISPVTEVTNLSSLRLENNVITNISTISGLTNLSLLDLSSNQITDISAIAELPNLGSLYLSDNQITDISAVTELTNLYYLKLNDNNITDISAVSSLTNLGVLYIWGNSITNISPLAGMTNLNSLSLSSNSITDISPLAGMTNLNSLRLSSNNITDISVVAGLTNLNELTLSNNNITNISAVAVSLTDLTSLFVSDNQIETLDLRGANWASLEYFLIDNNPLTKVLMNNSTLSSRACYALMHGISKVDGVLSLDMSGIDFTDFSSDYDLKIFPKIHTMDDLEKLSFVNATNLDGSEVVTMTNELDSLNWLNVAGLWDSFDATEQSSLSAWGAAPENTLITLFGDANGDGMVNASDATVLAGNWQAGTNDSQIADWSMGDFNCDGQVNASDATVLASCWQQGTSNTAVPEPATISMLAALVGLAVFLKKRRA